MSIQIKRFQILSMVGKIQRRRNFHTFPEILPFISETVFPLFYGSSEVEARRRKPHALGWGQERRSCRDLEFEGSDD
jgi:hypothetical protein